MSRPSLLSAVCALTSGATLAAQSATTVAPTAYQPQFENAKVKVARVHYATQQRLAELNIPADRTSTSYLNDGGPVLFKASTARPSPSICPPN